MHSSIGIFFHLERVICKLSRRYSHYHLVCKNNDADSNWPKFGLESTSSKRYNSKTPK